MAMTAETRMRLVRYAATGTGGTVGGAALGGIIYASGATTKAGAAVGFGALIGLMAGLATAGAADIISLVSSSSS